MATAKKKKIVLKSRGVADSNGFVSVRSSFNPVWKPQEKDFIQLVPTGVHAGKAMKGQDESWLLDGVIQECKGKFVTGGKLVNLSKGDKAAVGMSAAFMETKKSFGHRLVKVGGKSTTLLQHCIDSDSPILITFTGKVKSGKNTFKQFDIAVQQSVLDAID